MPITEDRALFDNYPMFILNIMCYKIAIKKLIVDIG